MSALSQNADIQTKTGPALEGKQLPLALIDRDSGIQKV